MAIYHFTKKYVSRGKGASAVGAAAYRAGEKLFDERRGRHYSFLRKTGVVHSEIMLPEGAPDRLSDRATLWNEVEARETLKNARLADEIEVAIPREMTQAQSVRLVREFVAEQLVKRGMIVDLNVHWDVGADGNLKPHAHIMMTTRTLRPDGFGLKERKWQNIANLWSWRKAWADHVNTHLAMLDIDARVDHRSLRAQGIDLEPQHKIGPAGARRAGRGEYAERADDHRRIARENGAKIITDPSIALDAITRSQSTFSTRDLAMFAHRHSDGQAQFDQIMAAVRASPELVALGQDSKRQARFTSREMVEIERRLERAGIDLVGRADHRVAKNLRDRALLSAERGGLLLSSDQRAALEHISGPERLTSVIGYAGTGKSAMLSVARETWKGAGYHVRGAALSGMAAGGLEKGSGIASRTIASLEYQWGRGYELLTSRDVLVIDEAGMIGTRQMERLLVAARDAGAKIVLVGDPEQLQAIEAGAAFRSLAERHGATEITEVRRQHVGWQRDATKHLATGRTAEAVHAYAAHAMVQSAPTRDLARAQLIERWDVERRAAPGRTRIILTHSNAEVHKLNLAARARLRDAGTLGADIEMSVARGARAFAAGDRVMFFRNDRGLGVKNGSLGLIEQIGFERLIVRLDEGRSVDFSLQQYAQIDYGYAATIHKSQGATVDTAHVLATPGLDRHSTYVALSRHRDGLQLHYGRDDFDDQIGLARVLSRERAKDMASDYGRTYREELRVFAERRGLTGRVATLNDRAQAERPRREIEITEAVSAEAGPPALRSDSFDGVPVSRTRKLTADGRSASRPQSDGFNPVGFLPSLSHRPLAGPDRNQAALARAIVRISRSALSILDAQKSRLPIFEHQIQALSHHLRELDRMRPDGVRGLLRVFKRAPALVREAAAGRAGPKVAALMLEAGGRADPQARAERFMAGQWALEREADAAGRDHDADGVVAAANAWAMMAKSLGQDPQVEAILRSREEASPQRTTARNRGLGDDLAKGSDREHDQGLGH